MIGKSLIVSMALTQAQFDQCADNLVRKAQTLTYTCELDIPVKSKTAKFQNLRSPKSLRFTHGGIARDVQIEVSPDARVLSLTTTFDTTGLDLEVSKFNDDFFAVYNSAAHTIISGALRDQILKIEINERAKK